jgi:hypothetical protein
MVISQPLHLLPAITNHPLLGIPLRFRKTRTCSNPRDQSNSAISIGPILIESQLGRSPLLRLCSRLTYTSKLPDEFIRRF